MSTSTLVGGILIVPGESVLFPGGVRFGAGTLLVIMLTREDAVTTAVAAAYGATAKLSFLWLEITGTCQLACTHCYAESGPQGTHGLMTEDDWLRIIADAVSLRVQLVQFIGGEPTLHPSFPALVRHARERGLAVEVFTNLANVSRALWDVFSLPGVRLATSYYSDQPGQHETITARRGSHGKTMSNIAEAVRRSIPLRVGLIDVADGQRVDQARRQLAALGVTEVSTDRLRQVGRGVRDEDAGVSQLCGACAHGKVAVAANGDVWPCVFARWMPLGNVRSTPLAEIVSIERMARAQAVLSHKVTDKCSPNSRCGPSKSDCKPNCPPGYHTEPKRCWPYYYEDRKR